MKNGLFLLLLLCMIGCARPKEETATSGKLQLVVSDSHAALAEQEANEFHRLYPEAEVTISAVATREAIVQLINASARCILVDRKLNSEEQGVIARSGLEIQETPIGNDALAILVNVQNKLVSITVEELGSILKGEVKDWRAVGGPKAGGHIELCLTGRNSGAYELLSRHFYTLREAIPVSIVANDQAEALEVVARRPWSLGIVSAAFLRDTSDAKRQLLKRSVRVLEFRVKDSAGTVQQAKLHQANIYNAVYPLYYSLYIYLTIGKAGVAEGFTTFVTSTTGQKIILNAGLVPRQIPYRVVQLN